MVYFCIKQKKKKKKLAKLCHGFDKSFLKLFGNVQILEAIFLEYFIGKNVSLQDFLM